MQASHAKAIKYLGIATIVVAALTLLGCLIGFIAMSALSAYSSYYPSGSGYGYGYGHHGMMMSSSSYSDAAAIALITGVGGAVLFWKLACAVVAGIAGIMAVRVKTPTAHNMRTVFIWALVGAICSLLAGSFITMVLLIIIAVFSESDRKALEGGAAPAPQAAPVPAAATTAPTNAAYAASYADDIQPVAPAVAATAYAEQPVDHKNGPAVAENEAIAEEGTAAAAFYANNTTAVIQHDQVKTENIAPDAVESVEVAEQTPTAVAVAAEEMEALNPPTPDEAQNPQAAQEAEVENAAVEAVAVEVPAETAPETAAQQTLAAADAEDAHIANEGQAAAEFYQGNAAQVTETPKAQAADAEDSHIVEEGKAAADFYKDNAAQVTEAAATPAQMEAQGQAEELEADAQLAPGQTEAPVVEVSEAPEAAETVAAETIAVDTTVPSQMADQGEAEELKADAAMEKEQDSPKEL